MGLLFPYIPKSTNILYTGGGKEKKKEKERKKKKRNILSCVHNKHALFLLKSKSDTIDSSERCVCVCGGGGVVCVCVGGCVGGWVCLIFDIFSVKGKLASDLIGL